MKLSIVWRNTIVPPRLNSKVQRLRSAEHTTLFIARSARTVRIFEVLNARTGIQGPDYWVDLPRSTNRHVEVIEL